MRMNGVVTCEDLLKINNELSVRINELEQEKAELLEKIEGLFSRSGYDKYDDGYDRAISDVLDIFRKQEESYE